MTGWTIGAGSEWSFAPRWSVKAEYLYYDLGKLNYGTSSITGSGGAGAGTPFVFINMAPSTEFKGSLVRLGLNYKLDLWGN